MEHVLEYVEIPKFSEEDLEAFQCNGVDVQTVDERDVVYKRQVGHSGVQVYVPLIILTTSFDAILLTGEILRSWQVHVHVPHPEDIVDVAQVFLGVDDHPAFDELVMGR